MGNFSSKELIKRLRISFDVLKSYLPKAHEIFDSNCNSDDIRQCISEVCEKYSPKINKMTAKTDYSYRFEENLIYLYSSSIKHWWAIEIELRDYSEPRLRVKFVLFEIYLFIAVIFALPALNNSEEVFLGFALLFVSIFLISLAIYQQINFRNWLGNLISTVRQNEQ